MSGEFFFGCVGVAGGVSVGVGVEVAEGVGVGLAVGVGVGVGVGVRVGVGVPPTIVLTAGTQSSPARPTSRPVWEPKRVSRLTTCAGSSLESRE